MDTYLLGGSVWLSSLQCVLSISLVQTKSILTQLYPGSTLQLQCTSDEIDSMCNEYDSLNEAKRVISNIGKYKPDISGQANWLQAHINNSSLLVRYSQFVEYQPVRLNATHW